MPRFLALLVRLLALALLFAAPRGLAQFSAGTTASVSGKLNPAAKALAGQIYGELAPANSPTAIGNVAVGLWMTGRLQVALQLMGQAVAADPANTDNQCNYAAMLTMSGAAAQALPVLEQLAKKFPENPTVLNNLGQAYYLAGDEEKSEKALGRALAVAPAHAQAAATQSRIAEGKGDTARATALAKQALQHGVSADKLNRLRKLRHRLTLDDLKDSRPADPDPLGLHNFTAPPFPTNAVEENRTRREWAAFAKEIETRLQTLHSRLNAVQAPAIAAANARALAAYTQIKQGGLPTAQPASDPVVRPFARKAKLMLDLLDRDAGAKLRLKRAKDALADLVAKNQQLIETEYRTEYAKLERKDANQTGEGLANESYCERFVALADKYVAKWSDGRETAYREYLLQLRLKLSEEIYWQQFVQPRDEFAATVLKAQIEWLGALMACGIRADGSFGIQVDESCLRQKQAPRGVKLSNFNDVHCQYHSELHLGIGSIVTDCDKMVSTLGVGPVKLGMSQDMAQGTDFHDSFVSCTVEVSVGKSAGAQVGPVSVEVGAEAGVGVEIGRGGVEDVYVTGKVEASVMNVVGSGAEGRMSLVSGSSSVDML